MNSIISTSQRGPAGYTELFDHSLKCEDFPDFKSFFWEFHRLNRERINFLASRGVRVVLLDVYDEYYAKCERALYVFEHPLMPSKYFSSPFATGGGVALVFVNDGEIRCHPLDLSDLDLSELK